MKDRRLMGFLVSPEIIAACGKAGTKTIRVDSKIPADAEFVWSYFCDQRRAYVVVMEHESFPLVSEGSVLTLVPCEEVQVTDRPDSDAVAWLAEWGPFRKESAVSFDADEACNFAHSKGAREVHVTPLFRYQPSKVRLPKGIPPAVDACFGGHLGWVCAMDEVKSRLEAAGIAWGLDP